MVSPLEVFGCLQSLQVMFELYMYCFFRISFSVLIPTYVVQFPSLYSSVLALNVHACVCVCMH